MSAGAGAPEGRFRVKDKREFQAYLRACTDQQAQGVYDKEHIAGRTECVTLAVMEAARRGLELQEDEVQP